MPDNVLHALQQVLSQPSGLDISTLSEPPRTLLEYNFDEHSNSESDIILVNETKHDKFESESVLQKITSNGMKENYEFKETDRSIFYIEAELAPLASPEVLSETASLCSRYSIYRREHTVMQANLGVEENIVCVDENTVTILGKAAHS